jgi:hypothetical protein
MEFRAVIAFFPASVSLLNSSLKVERRADWSPLPIFINPFRVGLSHAVAARDGRTTPILTAAVMSRMKSPIATPTRGTAGLSPATVNTP